ncbi:MAG: S9 family peptidase [Candidatus Promineifilaceae bacterium]
MQNPTIAPYGSWKSPITSDLVSVAKGRINEPRFSQGVVWLEQRPSENGRYALVRRSPDGELSDVTPMPFNVRTRVHEYGGGSYIATDSHIYFVNFADQRVYQISDGGQPEPITLEDKFRYADFAVDSTRNLLFCVREDHRGTGEPVNELAVIPTDGNLAQSRVIKGGHDFFASPCLSPDGSKLAWISWDHPNMPWDGTQLWVASIGAGGWLDDAVCVAGGTDESIFQPQWSPDGKLHFVSDRSGWWNLYRLNMGEVEPLCEQSFEFGLPHWVFGRSTYDFISAEKILCTYGENGISHLATIDTTNGTLTTIPTDFTDIEYVRVQADRAIFAAGSATQGTGIFALDLGTQAVTPVSPASDNGFSSDYISKPEAIEFPTENDLTAHAFFYPPHNPDFQAPDGEKAPLLVLSHGGPTSASAAVFSLKIQYWTSRGIGVVDVNYGGSTGYGRAYRQRLNGQWGIVDSEDCINAARYLVDQGQADTDRLIIRGGSAGGYTTLYALTFHDFFSAGSSHYGVSDLETLAQDTHKFESRYLDSLIGPYPERKDIYIKRSPIHSVDQLSCPLIILQGLEDRVVPPSQAESMFVAVRDKGIPVAYLPFEGEQHGFRKSATIKRVYEAELYFFSRIFSFPISDEVEPVVIENL